MNIVLQIVYTIQIILRLLKNFGLLTISLWLCTDDKVWQHCRHTYATLSSVQSHREIVSRQNFSTIVILFISYMLFVIQYSFWYFDFYLQEFHCHVVIDIIAIGIAICFRAPLGRVIRWFQCHAEGDRVRQRELLNRFVQFPPGDRDSLFSVCYIIAATLSSLGAP